MTTQTALVTGASSGIGASTARDLAGRGFHVICVARRTERITDLADQIGGTAITCDVTDPAQVAALASAVGGSLDILVNNAGGAFGQDHIEHADPTAWRAMFEVNVLGTLHVTQALLPALEASGAGTVINVGSLAGHVAYEGGGGYTAAKHGVAVLTETLRLELNGRPIRITELAPGLVRTEEFSLVRFGDREKADAVYAGVRDPLVAEDVADAIGWVATRPMHVNVDLLVIKPLAQAGPHKLHRSD